MKKTVFALICLFAVLSLAFIQDVMPVRFGTVPVKTCLTEGCHPDEKRFAEIANGFENDIHALRGITCYDCHQPSKVHYEEGDPSTENDRVPYPWEQPDKCGSCHSNALIMKRYDAAPDITAEQIYWTSHHGQSLKRVKDSVEEGTVDVEEAVERSKNVATCSSCHGVHGMVEVSSPKSRVFPLNVAATCGECHGDDDKMLSYSELLGKIDPSLAKSEEEIDRLASALTEYSHSSNIHRIALEEKGLLDAPTCNDCHGNHGATPPGAFGATRVAEVCGSCHNQNYVEYENSIKSAIFDDDEYRDCYACHTNHTILKTSDEMVGMQETSVCFECHQDTDLSGVETITGIKAEIDLLKAQRDEALELLLDAENKGMDVEAGHEKLVELNTALITARGKIHSFDVEPVKEVTGAGRALAAEAKLIGEEALSQLVFRQWGLGASSLIIIFVIILLYLKIKEVDKRHKIAK